MTRKALLFFSAMLLAVPEMGWPQSAGEGAPSVRSLPADLLAARPKSQRAQKLMEGYYDSVSDWGEVLHKRVKPVPGRPGWAYYGLGGHTEDHVRPICYAAMVNAFLSEVHPPGREVSPQRRARMRRDAIAALRYLTNSHFSGGGACLDGEPWGWGNKTGWQSALWARAVGMAGWMLWPHLDDQMRRAVCRLVAHEADQVLQKPPKDSEFRDTGAEENAWNSGITSLASNMMPDHPRAQQWAEAAKRYMYNSLSVAADRNDNRRGDDGRPVRQWVTTVNAHPDFTVENHGLVHVGYLKLTAGLLLESAAHYVLAGTPVPQASLHHVPEALDVILSAMAWEGSPVYFGGNDWKEVHTQGTDVIVYAMASLLKGDARTAYLEDLSVDWLRRIQREQHGFYNVRRDIEYGGLVATRLISCYMAHAVLGEGAKPVSEVEFNTGISGVRHLEYAQTILHRTPTKFASFSWGPKRLALALPRDGTWAIWPHFASYLGVLNGEEPSSSLAPIEGLRHDVQANSFSVNGTLKRLKGGVIQDFGYASLPNDLTIYVERLRVSDGFRLTARETGVVGHEYEFGTNRRVLYGRFGKKEVRGVGGRAGVLQLNTDWLNIGGRIGYVVRRAQGRENVLRYHDLTKGVGRVPKLEEWLSLIGDRDPSAVPPTGDWACVVTFLNQPPSETALSAGRVKFSVDGNAATCRIGQDAIRVDFAERKTQIAVLPAAVGHPGP
jgi:hypothetical protein